MDAIVLTAVNDSMNTFLPLDRFPTLRAFHLLQLAHWFGVLQILLLIPGSAIQVSGVPSVIGDVAKLISHQVF